MKRFHEEIAIALRNWRNHRRMHVESNKRSPYDFGKDRIGQDPYIVDCECDDQIGRFRKKDAFDCGNTKCFICHSDKIPKRTLTEQEIIADIDFREQIKEFLQGDNEVTA
jgi:hypothetical protein